MNTAVQTTVHLDLAVYIDEIETVTLERREKQIYIGYS